MTITKKVDIYAFGLVTLQLVMKEKVIVKVKEKEKRNEFTYPQIYHVAIKKKTKSVPHALKTDGYSDNSAEKLINLAITCMARNQADRPPIDKLREVLDKIE